MKNSISLFLFLLLTYSVQAQNTLSPDLNSVVAVPQSPEAAAFEKYGNVPVSMYTGTPQISVPLFNIQGREMSMPISLSYDASGVKVEQVATSVGLGWNLNAGGAVTRQVAGLPDGYPETSTGFEGQRIFDPLVTGFLDYTKANNVAPFTTHPKGIFQLLDQFERDQQNLAVDLEPDVFSFNINGLSGNIFINYAEDTAYCQNDPNIRVEFEFDPTDPLIKDQLSSWTITGPDGTRYIFAKKEVTNHTFQHRFGQNIFPVTQEYTSAWYISQIISPSKKDQIIFNYSGTTAWTYPQPILNRISSKSDPVNSGSLIALCGTGTSSTESLSNDYFIRQFHLQSISINGRTAAVFYEGTGNSERKDLKGRFPLKSIDVYDQLTGSSVANTIRLKHSYFGDLNDTTATGTNSENLVRLMLESVHILGDQSPGTQSQVYSFDYDSPTLLPHRDDLGVDYWGYFNGANNTDLIPAYDDGNGFTLPGANRNADLTSTKIGTLTKINYPTGGLSEFFYSLHSLPPTQNQYLEETREFLFSLQGGEDSSDPYDYQPHDDYLYPLTPIEGNPGPKGQDAAFQINSDEFPAKVRFELVGTPTDNNFRQYVALYRTADGDCNTTPCPSGTERNFNELINQIAPEPLEIVYFDDPFAGPSTFLEVAIPSNGAYRVMVLNTDPQVSVSVEVVRTEIMTSNTPLTAGGLRVFKTVDRKESGGADELTKFYYYGDFSGFVNPESVATSVFGTNYSSSGVQHAPLRFHALSSNNNCEGGTSGYGPYTCVTLTRHSSNLLRSIGPHVSYSTVSEVSYSAAEGYNGFSVYDYYNEQETVGDIPFSKRKLANGEVSRSRIFDKYGNPLEETFNYFTVKSIIGIASTRGMIKRSISSQTGIKYTQDTEDTIGVYAFQGYMEWCKDPTPGVINIPPPPCSGTVLDTDTLWINGPGGQVNSTIDLTVNFLGFIIELSSANENYGGPNYCSGTCQEGIDYRLVPITLDQSTNLPVRCEEGTFQNYSIITYVHSSFWLRLDSTVTIRYENGNSQSVLSENFYDRQPANGVAGHYQLTGTKTTNSDGNVYTSKIIYPDDIDFDIR